jgi:hypothetical protein
MLVEAEPSAEVVAEATLAADAGRLARDRRADVLVLSAQLLTRGGTGVLPASCTLVHLGLEDHPMAAAEARARGATHYVVWDQAADDLPPLLRELAVQPFVA